MNRCVYSFALFEDKAIDRAHKPSSPKLNIPSAECHTKILIREGDLLNTVPSSHSYYPTQNYTKLEQKSKEI